MSVNFSSNAAFSTALRSPNTQYLQKKQCRQSTIAFAGKGRRSNTAGGRQSKETFSEDVEVFSLDSGWNVEALSAAEASDLLDGLEGWSVDSFSDQRDADDDDDYDSDEEDDVEFDIGSTAGANDFVFEVEISGDPKMAQKAAAKSAEQDLLARLPRHMVRKLKALQDEADAEESKLNPNNQRKTAARQKTHRRLKIVSGFAAGIRILSPQGDQTRPMMEMVRGAVFNMIASLHGTPGTLPEGTRWLDLFAGTGAVGIEALSRGCEEAHFVELSPWVTSNCLQPNLEKCGVEGEAVVHTTRAEDFLKRAAQVPRFAGGAFDFISVCPPYEAVSYTELYELLEESPLVHENTIIIVEYPKKVVREVRDSIKGLTKLRDRKYGRTLIAIYGPSDDEDDDFDEDED